MKKKEAVKRANVAMKKMPKGWRSSVDSSMGRDDMGIGWYVVLYYRKGHLSVRYYEGTKALPSGWWGMLSFTHPGAGDTEWTPRSIKVFKSPMAAAADATERYRAYLDRLAADEEKIAGWNGTQKFSGTTRCCARCKSSERGTRSTPRRK